MDAIGPDFQLNFFFPLLFFKGKYCAFFDPFLLTLVACSNGIPFSVTTDPPNSDMTSSRCPCTLDRSAISWTRYDLSFINCDLSLKATCSATSADLSYLSSVVSSCPLSMSCFLMISASSITSLSPPSSGKLSRDSNSDGVLSWVCVPPCRIGRAVVRER